MCFAKAGVTKSKERARELWLLAEGAMVLFLGHTSYASAVAEGASVIAYLSACSAAQEQSIRGLLRVRNPTLPAMDVCTGGIATIGKSGVGNSDEDIVVRIKVDAPVLRPDEPVPECPVL